MRKSLSVGLTRLVSLVGIAFALHLAPAYAYCPYQCAGNYSNYCQSMCGVDRRSPEQTERDRQAEAERQKRTQQVLAEFTARRDRLQQTDPSSPQFKTIFEVYKKARRKRDGDLLGAYAAAADQNLLGVLLTGGSVLQVLDEPYQLPPMSRKAFHEYAAAQLNRVLNGTSILSIMSEDGSIISSEEGSAIGSYGRYVSLADKQELDVWKTSRGIATEPYPVEPVSPQEEARKRRQTAEIQGAHDHAAAAKTYGQCVMETLQMGVRPTSAEMAAARRRCESLKPPPRMR